MGGYATWQHLLPGKALCTPFDSDIPEDMEEYVAARKLERVAAYRQLQGISKRIHLLTKNKLSIASYTLPDGCHVRAVAADEQRDVVSEHGRDHVFFVNTVTQARTRILPIGVHVFRLLVLMLDQGSIGCAGVAFATFQLGKLIHAKFDKIHRLVRDLKLSEQHAWPHQLFTKTKLWSAYLYALNNRPFSSGANATLKGMFLNRFRISESITSAIFLKYLCRMSKDWHMPCETDREKRAIFARVLEMKSFLQKGSQPKVSNWFSWNKQAYEQMPEFWPTRMVLEADLDDEPDPDTSGCDFETGAGNPQRQLQAILKQGGGLSLAYKLMKEKLQTHVIMLWVAEKACWDYYTAQVETVKNAGDSLGYSLNMLEG